MRIAWTGAAVGGIESGSVGLLGGQLLVGLLDAGAEVDVYDSGTVPLPAALQGHPKLRVVSAPVRWSGGRWYARGRALALVSSFAARALAQVKLNWSMVRHHRRRPYDCVFQFSQTELLLLGLVWRLLPPIVVHPSTIAAGELRWHRIESRYGRASEGLVLHLLARMYLILRARLQRRQLAHAALVIGASEAFLRTIATDYGIPAERLRLLRHPIAIGHFADVPRREVHGRRAVLLFASRLSVRKGLEMVLDLSHRLDDLADRVHIVILGNASLWSDYSRHLKTMNQRVAGYGSHRRMESMAGVYEQADVVLAPSHWEPFSLVTAEALAAGIPVVASDQIGAAEGIDPAVCRTFPAGDADAFEREVRRLVEELARPGAPAELAGIARAEARAHFAPAMIGAQLHEIVGEFASGAAARGS